MKRFQSRIESLRRLRQQTEQLAKLEAAVRQGEKIKANRHVEELQQQLSSLHDCGIQEIAGHTSANMLQSLSRALLLGESKLHQAREIQEQAATAVSQALVLVAHARTQLDIVDDFRDRELDKHRKEQRNEEENTRQDTNSRRRQRAARQNGGTDTMLSPSADAAVRVSGYQP